jgi:RecB family endonuclease NucS
VVIELKRDQTDDEAIGQLSRYMGWAAEHKAAAQGVGVRGIIVVHELTPKLRAAAVAHRNIEVYRYELTLALSRVPVRKEDAGE